MRANASSQRWNATQTSIIQERKLRKRVNLLLNYVTFLSYIAVTINRSVWPKRRVKHNRSHFVLINSTDPSADQRNTSKRSWSLALWSLISISWEDWNKDRLSLLPFSHEAFNVPCSFLRENYGASLHDPSPKRRNISRGRQKRSTPKCMTESAQANSGLHICVPRDKQTQHNCTRI